MEKRNIVKNHFKNKIKKAMKKKIWLWIAGLLGSSTTLFLVITTAIIVLMISSLIMVIGGASQESNSSATYDLCYDSNFSDNIDAKKAVEIFDGHAAGTKLAGKSKYIIESAEKHKISPSIFMAIIAMETGWGKSVDGHNNVAGMMGSGSLFYFDSVEEGIDAAAKNLYDLYFKLGLNTPEKIGPKYAPVGAANDPSNKNSNWIKNVTTTAQQFSKASTDTEKDKDDKKNDKEDKENDACGGLEMSGEAAKFAISIAYPRDQHARANTTTSAWGENVAPKKYIQAKQNALKIATSPEGMKDLYASCDRFVATVIINTTDRNFPWGSTTEQQNYLANSPKWKQYTKKSEAKPGDVWVTRTNGHVILYAGKYQGIDTIVHASYTEFVGRVDGANYLNENLVDTGGRAYYGYHYIGDKKK